MYRIHRILYKNFNKHFRPDPLTVLKEKGLIVGKNFHMGRNVIIDNSHCWLITIGDHVTLAPRVIILAHDASTKMHLNYTKIKKVNIGNHVFVGAGSIILPGVKIGNNVVIGAGSIISHNIPNGVVAAGNPVKVLDSIEDFLNRRKKEMDNFPCFGNEYSLRENVSESMKDGMNKKMSKRYGFLI
jgi:maltose O-acetyltransferase